MANVEQTLYDQAVYDATFEDPNKTYKQYIQDLQRQHEQKFLRNTSANRSPEDKRIFEEKLRNYLTHTIQAHNSFISNGGRLNAKGELVFKNQTAADQFEHLVEKAAQSNMSLYDFQKDMKIKSQYGMLEQDRRAYDRIDNIKEQSGKAGKGLLKGLGIAALVGLTGWGAVKGGKAISNAMEDADRDIRMDRIEHRVDITQNKMHTTSGVRRGAAMDFATDSSGNYIRTQRVMPQRPVVDHDDVDMTVIEETEVVDQTEEFNRPQLPEIIEEVHVVQPQPQTVIKKVVHTPAPQPVVHETIEEIHEQVEQNATAYQSVVVPTRTVVHQVQQPVLMQPQPVVQTVAPAVDHSQLLNNLTDLGISAINAHAQVKTARYMSRKGPDSVSITKIDDHSIRGSFNDNSSRSYRGGDRTLVTNNGNTDNRWSGNTRATTRVDASSRTTVDARRYSIGNNSGNGSNRGNTQTKLRQTNVRQTNVRQTNLRTITPQARPGRTTGQMRTTMRSASQRGSFSSTPVRTQSMRTTSVNTGSAARTGALSRTNARSGSPMRRGR